MSVETAEISLAEIRQNSEGAFLVVRAAASRRYRVPLVSIVLGDGVVLTAQHLLVRVGHRVPDAETL